MVLLNGHVVKFPSKYSYLFVHLSVVLGLGQRSLLVQYVAVKADSKLVKAPRLQDEVVHPHNPF